MNGTLYGSKPRDKGKQVAEPPSTSLVFNSRSADELRSIKCIHKTVPRPPPLFMNSDGAYFDPGHAPHCQDPECDGCDVGQVDLDLPSDVLSDPMELWKLAQSEILQETPTSDSDDGPGTSNSRETVELDSETHLAVISKLLDLAIEQFEATGKGKSPMEEIAYGQCLFERGKILDSASLVEKGLLIIEDQLKVTPDTLEDAPAAWTVLGKGRLEQVYARIRQVNTNILTDDSDADLVISDGEDATVGTSTNVVMSTKILLKMGITAINKGLELRGDQVMAERSRLSLARTLTEAASIIKSRTQADLALHLISEAADMSIPYLDQSNDSMLLVQWHAILGKSYFFTARIGRWIIKCINISLHHGTQHNVINGLTSNGTSSTAFDDNIRGMVDSMEKITAYVDMSIKHFVTCLQVIQQDGNQGRPIPKKSWIINVDYHLGQAFLLKSSLSSTSDDVAMQSYENAIKCLFRCLQNDPENENVRAQLEAMGALKSVDGSQGEEESSEEGEEINMVEYGEGLEEQQLSDFGSEDGENKFALAEYSDEEDSEEEEEEDDDDDGENGEVGGGVREGSEDKRNGQNHIEEHTRSDQSVRPLKKRKV